jgi:molecular chaperone DnaK
LETLKKALDGADFAAIKAAHETLSRVSQEAGGALYEQAAANAGGTGTGSGETASDDSVVDAEVVDEGADDDSAGR